MCHKRGKMSIKIKNIIEMVYSSLNLKTTEIVYLTLIFMTKPK
jgi:hypothetical protein